MGDAGVATSPDINSQNWNAAKYVFMKDKFGASISYVPWLRAITNDINLAYLSGYYKFDDKQVLSGGLRYFNLGSIQYTDVNGNPGGVGKPNEFAVDVGYTRLFSDYFSGGLVFRFIYSDIAGGSANVGNTIPYNPGISFAADLCAYYQHPVEISSTKGEMAFGLNISNIGTKMGYSEGDIKEFIPTDMRLGGRLSLDIDDYNSIGITVDLNKLLVPTPPKTSVTGDTILAGKNSDVGVIKGMFQSFYDAPGGFKEEMHEIMYSVGAEYWYRKQFAIRAGYFYEDKTKGNRKYFTAGIGFKLNVISLDFAYLIPSSGGRSNPLANTTRFTIGFTFK